MAAPRSRADSACAESAGSAQPPGGGGREAAAGGLKAAEMATKRLARCGVGARGRATFLQGEAVSGLGAEAAPCRRHAGCWGWRGAAGGAAGRRSSASASASCSSSTSSPPAGGTRGSAAPRSNQVDEGVPLNICLSQFLKWLERIQKEKQFLFSSDIPSNAIPEAKLCTFVTWTDWDLGVCLHYECKRKQLRKPDIFNSWIDLKATYRAFYNRKPKGLSGALQDLGLSFVGREHSGLDDSRNTARLAWRLICDGCVLKITKSLDKSYPRKNLISRTLNTNSADKTLLESSSSLETSGDRPCKANSLAERNHNGAAGIMVNSNVQSAEPTTCSDCSADMHVISSSSSRIDLCEETQSSSTVSADRFPLLLGRAQLSRSTLAPGIQQGLNNGHLMNRARYSSPVCGSGLVLISTTISSVNTSAEDTSTRSDCLSLLTDWEDVALIPKSQSEPNSDCIQSEEDSSTDILTVSEEKTIPEQSAAMSSGDQNLGKTVIPIEPPKSIIYKSPDTTVYNVGRVQRQTSNLSAFKIPSAKVNAISSQSVLMRNYSIPSEVPKRKPTSPAALPPAKKQSFAIYQEKTASSDHTLPLRNLNLSKASCAVLSSTVDPNQSVTAAQSEKRTPPLCNCGRRAKRHYVSNAGPNHGKAFFCCPVGRHEGNKRNCGYFKWENAFLKEKSRVVTMNIDALTSLGTSPSTSGNSSNKHLFLRPSMRT
ncbi:ERI1 exoribonuclease 2 isoform X2 [Numida meleagris]|uniref:ERI1 exoribonuclease 2 isoform X2 n=1 Tax=Numida meleagris TaxID=8996 RepID=UPI000B3DB245|nr:ERI1 exoribonuclease 2 isoform X2 [Numida meleagris]